MALSIPSLAEIKKALAALSAVVVVGVSAGLITGQTSVWITSGIGAVLAFITTYLGPANAAAPAQIIDTGPGSTIAPAPVVPSVTPGP